MGMSSYFPRSKATGAWRWPLTCLNGRDKDQLYLLVQTNNQILLLKAEVQIQYFGDNISLYTWANMLMTCVNYKLFSINISVNSCRLTEWWQCYNIFSIIWNLCNMLLQTCSPLYLRRSWVTRKRTFNWSAPILGSGLYQMRLPYKLSFSSSDKSSGDRERSLSQSSCTIVIYQTSRNLCCNKWSVMKFSFHILIILLNMNTCDVLRAALLLSLKVGEKKCWMQFKKTTDVWLFYLSHNWNKNLQCSNGICT